MYGRHCLVSILHMVLLYSIIVMFLLSCTRYNKQTSTVQFTTDGGEEEADWVLSEEIQMGTCTFWTRSLCHTSKICSGSSSWCEIFDWRVWWLWDRYCTKSFSRRIEAMFWEPWQFFKLWRLCRDSRGIEPSWWVQSRHMPRRKMDTRSGIGTANVGWD